jgi:ribonuclease-3
MKHNQKINNSNSLNSQRVNLLNNFQNKLKIHFDNINLLDLAFHHRSYANENGNHLLNNERLEFLGDSVLGMVVATYLYDSMRNHPEGDLAKIKSTVVSRTFAKSGRIVISGSVSPRSHLLTA